RGCGPDPVRGWPEGGRLHPGRSAGGQRVVDGVILARFLAALAKAAPRPDVVIGRSARNRFPGIVTRVVKDRVMAHVEMQAGPHRVVSLMSREAADELRLAPGGRAAGARATTP